MKKIIWGAIIGHLFIFSGCHSLKQDSDFTSHAVTLLDSTLNYYKTPDRALFYETYPKRDGDLVTYLAGTDTIRKDRVAYLWPTSGMFSAVNALWKTTGDKKYEKMIHSVILPGLELYYDSLRTPNCYQSYLTESGKSDRFYDDNLWLGLDFLELYELTDDKAYLDSARNVWNFIESGCDSILGGGIYWCEQKKTSKNTCSNAPAAVLALRLYSQTKEKHYLDMGQQIYHWTKENLRDDADGLYFDNIGLDGTVNKTKFQYNSGQMLQAAVLLYNLTHDTAYLEEAQRLAKACSGYFFENFVSENGQEFKVVKNGNIWFVAIMLRGFEELYKVDRNPVYLNDFKNTLQYMWSHNTNPNRLFEDDCFVEKINGRKESKWLLSQAAMIEMYARLARIE